MSFPMYWIDTRSDSTSTPLVCCVGVCYVVTRGVYVYNRGKPMATQQKVIKIRINTQWN